MNEMKKNRQMTAVLILLVIIILGVAFTSAYGVINADAVYITKEMSDANVPNDVVTLVLGLPAAIICLAFVAKKKTLALICLPGILYYFVYNCIVYFFEVELSWISILYLLLIGISLTVIVMIIAMIDKVETVNRLQNTVPAKFAGSVLVLLGVFVVAFQASEILSAANTETSRALYFADIAFGAPIMLMSGIYLIKRKAFGYIAGGSMLFSYIIQCLGLILLFVFKSTMNSTPLDTVGMAVIGVMALICIIPFGFFIKGFWKSK